MTSSAVACEENGRDSFKNGATPLPTIVHLTRGSCSVSIDVLEIQRETLSKRFAVTLSNSIGAGPNPIVANRQLQIARSTLDRAVLFISADEAV